MSVLKHRIAAAFAIVTVASVATFLQVQASHETDDQFGEDAVWSASTDELNEIGKACKSPQSNAYDQCFIDEMGGYASSEAVAFSQLLTAQKTPRVGYLTGIREAGLVDLGYVIYPGAGTSIPGWVLLNGVPALVNVDDLAVLPQSQMENDPQFAALRKIHPQLKLAVDKYQRTPETSPPIQSLADGAQRFVLPYSLREDCANCAPIAQPIFGFDFDASGAFLGAKFIAITGQP